MSKLTRKLEVLDDNRDGTLLKVAFASSDQKTVDQHFGSARSFVVYGVNQDEKHLITISEFGELMQDGNEDKLAVKLEVLEDCIAVYSRACGSSAVKQLLGLGIQPVKVSEGAEIEGLIEALQDELKQGASSWLAKAITRHRSSDLSRFDEMEAEGWRE